MIIEPTRNIRALDHHKADHKPLQHPIPIHYFGLASERQTHSTIYIFRHACSGDVTHVQPVLVTQYHVRLLCTFERLGDPENLPVRLSGWFLFPSPCLLFPEIFGWEGFRGFSRLARGCCASRIDTFAIWRSFYNFSGCLYKNCLLLYCLFDYECDTDFCLCKYVHRFVYN